MPIAAVYTMVGNKDVLPQTIIPSNYTYTDKTNADGTKTRTIVTDTVPMKLTFSSGFILSIEEYNIKGTDPMAAFSDCTELLYVNMANSVLSGNFSQMFYNCTSLTTVVTGEDWTISTASQMFGGASALVNVTSNILNANSVNTMINQLPSRYSNSHGLLTISNHSSFAQINVTAANGKYWDVVQGDVKPTNVRNLKVGSLVANKIMKGTSEVSAIYIGTTLVYGKKGGTSTATSRTLFNAGYAESSTTSLFVSHLVNENEYVYADSGQASAYLYSGQLFSSVSVRPEDNLRDVCYNSLLNMIDPIDLSAYSKMTVKTAYRYTANGGNQNSYIAFQFFKPNPGSRLNAPIQFEITPTGSSMVTYNFDISSYSGYYYFGILHYNSATSASTSTNYIESIILYV